MFGGVAARKPCRPNHSSARWVVHCDAMETTMGREERSKATLDSSFACTCSRSPLCHMQIMLQHSHPLPRVHVCCFAHLFVSLFVFLCYFLFFVSENHIAALKNASTYILVCPLFVCLFYVLLGYASVCLIVCVCLLVFVGCLCIPYCSTQKRFNVYTCLSVVYLFVLFVVWFRK